MSFSDGLQSLKSEGTLANDSSCVAIANSFGEGASGKAVSTYFERLKKDTQWNLANSIADNAANGGSARKATPRARKTPVKRKGAQGSDESGEGDEETPPKKGSMNKVQTGRVTKVRGFAKKTANYAEPESSGAEEDDDEGMMVHPVKEETMGMQGFSDIGSNGHGAHGNGGLNNGGSQYPVGDDGWNNADNEHYYDEDDLPEEA